MEQQPSEEKNEEIKSPKDKTPEITNFLEFLNEHPMVRKVLNIPWFFATMVVLLKSSQTRSNLITPLGRRTYFDQTLRVGLLEGSMISNDLYRPNRGETSLERVTAVAGRWHSWDFKKYQMYKYLIRDIDWERSREEYRGGGRLVSFPLVGIIDNHPDKLTSTHTFDFFNFDQILQFELSNISDLLKYGFIRESSLKEAYEKEGNYERYRRFIVMAGIGDDQVYVVTPKGNSLVFVAPDMGQPKRQPEKQTKVQTAPVFGS